MATYTDSFNRANGNLSANSNWAVAPFNATELVIESNAVVNTDSSAGFSTWEGDGTWGRTQEVEITLGAARPNRLGPVAYSSASGAYYLRVRPSNGAFQFYKIDGTGTQSIIGGSASTGGALSAGDTLKIRVEDDGGGGTLITGYYNGSEISTRTDSTFTSGKAGLWIDPYDDSSIDSWEGNDFQAAATSTVTATVTDQSGTALTDETGIAWHWTDSFSGTPTDSGSSETTDGTGEIVVDVPNSSLSSGQFGYLTVKLSNGNVGIAREAID